MSKIIGLKAVFFGGVIDLLYHRPGFFHAVYIGACELAEGHIFELCQQTLTEVFGRNAGAIGDKESRSFYRSLWALKLVTILGYDRRDFVALHGRQCHLFSGSRPQSGYDALLMMRVQRPELFQHS